MYQPGICSSKATVHIQGSFSSILSGRELGILVNMELSVSHQGKVASRDSDAVSTSL